MDVPADELERLAQSGDSEAQIALARRCEDEQKNPQARAWYARAAKQGSVEALRLLAINLLMRPPVIAGDGVNMIRSAAHKGDAEAAFVCAMLAAQDHHLEDRWAVARQCLVHAAERDWEPAREQISFLGRMSAADNPAELARAARLIEVSQSPRIARIEGFVSHEICDWLISRARPRIGRARVYDKAIGRGRIEEARSNSSAAFGLVHSDIVLMLVRARVAATVGVPDQALEPTSILHYAPGQKFEPHFDFFDPAISGYTEDLRARGQRVATFLLYLNEDFEGGETDFPKIGWRYRGRKGDALVFWNVTPDGKPDERMLHAGLPPSNGEKWLFSQWIRESVE